MTERGNLADVLDEYLVALEAGSPPDRDALLAQHPDLAEELKAALLGVDFVYSAAPRLAPEEHADVLPERSLGDYRLVRELGRGGMAVVYEAEQVSLGRKVALKVLPFAAVLDPKQLQRFKNEALAAAQLHHANIVPVYGVGCERGVHYYAMQYVEEQSLAAAQALCAGCPVRELCLDLGRARDEYGVWGGVLLENGKPQSAVPRRGRPPKVGSAA